MVSLENDEIDPGKLRKHISVKPSRSPLVLNGAPYRGTFIIHKKNGFVYVVNSLAMDEYLIGVVPCEIPPGWESEALKAQAVAARTYAYYHLASNQGSSAIYDLDATTNSQVYRGISVETDRTTAAVVETSGRIISYNSRPILSYFHSTCGGKTIDDRYVWSRSNMDYLDGVTCGFCEDSTKYTWRSVLTLDEIRSYLSKKQSIAGKIRNITFKRKDDRVTDVIIIHDRGKITLSGNNFRLLFPSEKMRSLYFTSVKNGRSLVLSGRGWGHGVGMCQWGARGMALRGYAYPDILGHYYHGVKVTDVRNCSVAYKK